MVLKNKGLCKIVTTLGPATSTLEKIEELVLAGATVFRLNCSHGSKDAYVSFLKSIRALEEKYNRVFSVIFDLQGPKLRIGTFKDGPVLLKKGEKFSFDMDPAPGDKTRVSMPHPEIFAVMHEGMELLINDGLVRVRVEKFGKDRADAEVIVGGIISDRKGVNVPGVKLPISALTEKDKKDLVMAEELGANWIALSFVQSPEDIQLAKSLMKTKAGIIAKIEKPHAVDNLEAIAGLADGVMVARGDLGVEMRPETVPVIQKKILACCRRLGKPVIVATQMLESMILNPTPTRAEASDVATAVYDGADAVMLSAETAAGSYPAEAVNMMSEIIQNVEKAIACDSLRRYQNKQIPTFKSLEYAITNAADTVSCASEQVNIIVNYTSSGGTTLRTAQHRPCMPILTMTSDRLVAGKLTLVYGVTTVVSKELEKFEEIPDATRKAVFSQDMAKPGEYVVITAGIPFGQTGGTNFLYLLKL